MHLREAILQSIRDRALKGTDLAIRCVELMHPSTFSTDDFLKTLERMVASGEIIEIEYTLPNRPNQVKSIYMPKGTLIQKVMVDGVEEWE